jgi:hypothetical protein
VEEHKEHAGTDKQHEVRQHSVFQKLEHVLCCSASWLRRQQQRVAGLLCVWTAVGTVGTLGTLGIAICELYRAVFCGVHQGAALRQYYDVLLYCEITYGRRGSAISERSQRHVLLQCATDCLQSVRF